MMDPTTLLRISQQKPLSGVPVFQATVLVHGDDTRQVRVVADTDEQTVIEVKSIVGPLPQGQRVLVQRLDPHGLTIVGYAGPPVPVFVDLDSGWAPEGLFQVPVIHVHYGRAFLTGTADPPGGTQTSLGSFPVGLAPDARILFPVIHGSSGDRDSEPGIIETDGTITLGSDVSESQVGFNAHWLIPWRR